MTTEFAVSLHVFTDNTTAVARAAEVLSRAAAGLALDGIHTSLNVGPFDDDHDEESPT